MTIQFDAGKALGFVFEVIRARPSDFIVLAAWTVLYGAAVSVFQIYGTSDQAAAMADFTALNGSDDPSVALQVMGQYFSATLPYLAIAMIVGIVVESAWLRLFVRGESGGVFPFRIGRDELVYGLTGLVMLLVLGGVMIIAMIAVILLAAVLSFLGPAGAFIGGALSFFLMLGVLIACLVLIMPALALSLLKRRFALVQAVGGARRIFWQLLGVALVAFVGYFVLVIMITSVVGIMPFDEFGRLPGGEMAGVPSLFVYYAITQAFLILPMALMRGVASYAALRIDEGGRPLSDTFE